MFNVVKEFVNLGKLLVNKSEEVKGVNRRITTEEKYTMALNNPRTFNIRQSFRCIL